VVALAGCVPLLRSATAGPRAPEPVPAGAGAP
jgi:hypothetical protein